MILCIQLIDNFDIDSFVYNLVPSLSYWLKIFSNLHRKSLVTQQR